MQKRYRSLIAVSSGAALLVLSACSSSNSGGSGSSGSAGGNSSPIKIAFLAILDGPDAAPGADDPFKLAISQINSSGGIDGRKIEYKEFNTDITTQGAVTAANLALAYNPSIMIGFQVSAGLQAAAPAIKEAGIPVLNMTLSQLTSQKSLGMDNVFRITPTNEILAASADDFLFNKLHIKSLSVLNNDTDSPEEGATSILAQAAKAGVRTVHRQVSASATDLTEPLIASKGTDAIWSWGNQAWDTMVFKAAQVQNYKSPIMTFTGMRLAQTGAIPASQFSQDYAVEYCGADVGTGTADKNFMSAYDKTFKSQDPPDSLSAAYDGVYLFKAAVQMAGSSDPAAVSAAIPKVKYSGICGTFKEDQFGNMIHSVPIVNYVNNAVHLVAAGSPRVSTY